MKKKVLMVKKNLSDKQNVFTMTYIFIEQTDKIYLKFVQVT